MTTLVIFKYAGPDWNEYFQHVKTRDQTYRMWFTNPVRRTELMTKQMIRIGLFEIEQKGIPMWRVSACPGPLIDDNVFMTYEINFLDRTVATHVFSQLISFDTICVSDLKRLGFETVDSYVKHVPDHLVPRVSSRGVGSLTSEQA